MHDIFHSNICMCACVTDDDEDVVESNENRESIERLEISCTMMTVLEQYKGFIEDSKVYV